ncbi:hypothetical protein [Streptomyces brevispora]|uniref:Uncharacterized protein n=1 Tax=Streptomyces brevispora TaxID=887462 RepID=A0ABZ1GHU7_9ACTN|nr:hypothetical protein [Streptomyces brevispora]WSC18153.1 hypothetical protein OIE64_32435 [Streptomyces brevispora]
MDSTPQPMPVSTAPAAIRCTARWDDPQAQSMVVQAVRERSGKTAGRNFSGRDPHRTYAAHGVASLDTTGTQQIP